LSLFSSSALGFGRQTLDRTFFLSNTCLSASYSVLANVVRAMCGSRTGGWSLPCVLSDWQRGVDWFLSMYCRCRLRLDWYWCRWRISWKTD
jgi:hypothetical protein